MTPPGPRPICLFGGGEHARVVAEAVVRGGRHVAGCWAPTAPAASAGLQWLGDDARLAAEAARWADAEFHVAFVGRPGGAAARRELCQRERGRAWGSVVHPDACVSRTAELGAGTFVGANAVIQAGARIGSHAVVNTAAVVEHDVEVGEGAHLATGAIVGGGARIGAWCWIGLGARIRDHVQIGDGAIVAMGAVVVADVAAGTTVIGIPARAKP